MLVYEFWSVYKSHSSHSEVKIKTEKFINGNGLGLLIVALVFNFSKAEKSINGNGFGLLIDALVFIFSRLHSISRRIK